MNRCLFIFLTMSFIAAQEQAHGKAAPRKPLRTYSKTNPPKPLRNAQEIVALRDDKSLLFSRLPVEIVNLVREFSPIQVQTQTGAIYTYNPNHPLLRGPAWCDQDDFCWDDRIRGVMNWQRAFDTCLNLNREEERDEIRAQLVAGQYPQKGCFLPVIERWKKLKRDQALSLFLDAGRWFWSGSGHPNDPYGAFDFGGYDGGVFYFARAHEQSVRCCCSSAAAD